MKFCSVVGTRPNFVKEFSIDRECKKRGINKLLVHTGQHYDYEMSRVFFEDFALPEPAFFLDVSNSDNLNFTAEVIIRLGKVFREERPDFVLSYGDVNSTLAAALAAAKLSIPFVHVEGGIRTPYLYNPEEINRRVADVLAQVIYCCTKTDFRNLVKEGFGNERSVLSGDLMMDTLVSVLSERRIVVSRGDYNVLTLHRQENISDSSRLEAIVEGVIQSGRRTIFPAHPRTMKQLQSFKLLNNLSGSNVEVVKPLGYLSFLKLAAGADKIITDSGGLRREAYLLRKPCIVVIEISWFPEIAEAGWKVLTKPDSKLIARLIREFEPTRDQDQIFGTGKARETIVNDLENRFGKSKA